MQNQCKTPPSVFSAWATTEILAQQLPWSSVAAVRRTRRPFPSLLMGKLLHLNLNHCRTAQDLMTHTVLKQQINVVLLSGPYKGTNLWKRSHRASRASLHAARISGDHQRSQIPGHNSGGLQRLGHDLGTPRGTALLDEFTSLNVCLLNIGSIPTYNNAGRESS
ncbi:uncharacterized protein [Drosophila pseudoobscura]|uniref:Uncharacterized protein n=2 Tax=Drosophila pseudoobscura pseudoobscura TaxID=46245 RepID=A0A6I8VJR1_DROPS|nr:uncharacterized protein LOC26532853 [Drosophila pseudoobscura]